MITALISDPDRSFQVAQIGTDLASLQRLVGGYIEAVTAEDVHIYCDEEGKLSGKQVNSTSTLALSLLIPGFANHDVLVGSIVWVGNSNSGHEAALPAEYVRLFSTVAMKEFREIVLIRQGDDCWVYDNDVTPLDKIVSLIDADKPPIQVYPHITGPQWVEMRGELADTPMTIHDERADRSAV